MLIAISIEYLGFHPKCSGCNVFGHTLATCPKAEEIKGTHGVVGTSLTHGKQNQFKWQGEGIVMVIKPGSRVDPVKGLGPGFYGSTRVNPGQPIKPRLFCGTRC